MSTSIDERIVAMKFDNRNFEKNAAESIQTIDLLKSKLNFEDVQEELNNINTSKIKEEFSSLGDINTSKFETVLDKLEYRMSGLGIFTGRIVQNVADDIYKIVKLAGSGIDKIISFTKGGIIQGGYSRAANIQQAKHQLEGLGIAWKDISADIDFAVKDTAYSLDAAAKAASQLVTSGLMPGYQYKTLGGQERDIDTLAMVLRAASGVAAMSGGAVDYSQITDIFVNAISKGKFQGDEFLRIAQGAGINAKQTLADYYNEVKYNGKTNWTADEIETMASKGQIDPMHAIEALYEKFGEHAVKANETLTGVMANTKSALARIGANFFEPIIANSGPLVTLFEVLRRSINDLNAAISPVVKLFANDVVQALEKLTNPFIEKEYERDENGEIKMDEKGNPMYTYKWKKVGGIFSDWLEPWHEATEVDSGIDRNHIPTMDAQQTYMEQYSSRAEKFASNMRTIFTSTGKIMYNFFSNNSKAFKQVFPEYKGMADLIVKVTTKIADKLEWISNLDFWNPPVTWKDSGWYAIIRGIFSGIDIIYRFGKALVEHFIKPIFSAGKTAASSLGIMDWIVKLSNAVYEFDQRLKNGEDVFGHFFEFIKNKLTQLKNFLGDLFTGKLNISEKLSSLKETLSTNVSIPGWDSIANVFRKIGDAIGYAFDKLKEFFGFGKKEDQLAFTTGAGGYATGGGLGLLNPILPNAGAVAGIIEKFGNKDDTKDLPTIGERISGFFGKIKEAFTNFDFSGISGMLTTFNIGIIAFISVLGFTLYKLFKLIDAVVYEMPRLVARFVSAFELLVDGLTKSLRAYRVEKYTQSLVNVSISIGIIVGAFVVLFAAIALIKKLDKENGVDSIETAGKIIAQIALLLGGFIALVMFMASKLSSSFSVGSLKDLSSINISTMQGTMIALAAILKTFIFGIIALSALLVIMGVIPDYIIKDGAKRLGLIALAFAGIILVIVAITEILSARKLRKALEAGKNLRSINYASGIMGIAGVIAAFAIGVIVLSTQLMILGIIPEAVWKKGSIRLLAVAGGLVITVLAIEFVMAVLNKWSLASSKHIAATLFGMSFLIMSFAINALTIVAALKLLDFVEHPERNAKTLAGIFAVMGVFSLLMVSFGRNATFSDYIGIALMMSVMSASLLLIASSIQMVGKVKNLDSSKNAIIGLLITIGGVLAVLSLIKPNTSMIGIMLSMAGIMVGLFALVGAISLAGKIDPGELLQGSLIVGVSFAVIAGLVFALNKLAGEKQFAETAKLAASIALLSLALVPAAAAIGILMVVLKGTDVKWYEMLSLGGALVIALGGVALVMLALNKLSGDIDASTGKHLLASLGSLVTVCLMMVPVVAAISLLFFAYKASNINLGEAAALMGLFAGVIFLVGAGVGAIVGTISEAGKTTAFSMKQATRSIVAAMAAIGVLMLGMGATIALVTYSGASLQNIISVGVITLVLAGVATLMIKALTSMAVSSIGGWNEKRVNKLIEALVAICGTLVILGMAVGILSTLDTLKLGGATVIVAVIGGILVGMIKLLTMISDNQDILEDKGMPLTIATLITATISLSVLAAGVALLSQLNIGKLWNSVGIMFVMGSIIAGLTWVLGLLAKFTATINPAALIFPIASLVTITLSLTVLSFAMMALTKYDFERIAMQMILFGGGLAVLAGVLALIGELTGLLAINMILSFGGMCLGLAAAMAAAGVLFFLAGEGIKVGAEGIDILVDSLSRAGEKSDSVKKGLSTFGAGIGEGLVSLLNAITLRMPEIVAALTTIMAGISKLVVDTLKILIHDVAGLISDPEVIEDITKLCTGLADIIFDGMLGSLAHLGERLVNEVIEPYATQLGEDLWEVVNGANFRQAIEDTNKSSEKLISEALERNISSWEGFDSILASEIMKSPEMIEAIKNYNDLIWSVGTPTEQQRQEFYDKVKKIAETYKETMNQATKAAFVKEGTKEGLGTGIQNGEYYQARTARMSQEAAEQEQHAKLIEHIKSLANEFEPLPDWALKAIEYGASKIPDDDYARWLMEYAIPAIEREMDISDGEKSKFLLERIGDPSLEGILAAFELKGKIQPKDLPSKLKPTKEELTEALKAKSEGGFDIRNEVSWLTKDEVGFPIVEGLLYNLLHPSTSKMSKAARSFADAILSELKSPEGFDINSPSKKAMPIGEQVTEGVVVGMLSSKNDIGDATLSLTEALNTGLNPMYNAGKSDGEAYGEGITDGIKNSGIGDAIKENIKKKINFDDLKGKVGFDKGIKENVEGIKDIWSTIKNAVTNDEGEFDLGFITEGIDIQEEIMKMLGLSDITAQFSAAGVGNIDTSAFNMDLATQSLDMSSWKNEFEGFDVNDAISSNTLDLKIDLDTSAYDDFYKESATGNLIRGIPTQTYQRIPTNSSYVNNYTYNQNITSTQPLSTREVNRNTQLALTRNRWNVGGGGGLRR